MVLQYIIHSAEYSPSRWDKSKIMIELHLNLYSAWDKQIKYLSSVWNTSNSTSSKKKTRNPGATHQHLHPKFISRRGCRFHKHFRNVCSSEHICYWDVAAWYVSNQVSEMHTLLPLQVCLVLSEKSMRQSPPLRARAIFRGSRSPWIIPIRWRSRTNVYNWDLARNRHHQWEAIA